MGIASTINQIFGPEIGADYRLNTAHLAIATRGYYIQTEIFRIPERFGVFSPGPPRLQAHQGFLFVIQTVLVAIWGVPAAFGFLLLKYTDREFPMTHAAKLFGLMTFKNNWGEEKVRQG
ncbi:hypothetical protein CGLO_01351 [Colletotrichum gloeosporioides Cg-14]|uniref:Uncharacterized protein n=1 Tax=Colletotrichum gloeosporioides (strain Cg-14) TaxID=1237896 RepID=T0L0G3_COLGC|nr:hypothetical protein CGLO_01351 [Colletotrichum gloeosporioides Cg-14]